MWTTSASFVLNKKKRNRPKRMPSGDGGPSQIGGPPRGVANGAVLFFLGGGVSRTVSLDSIDRSIDRSPPTWLVLLFLGGGGREYFFWNIESFDFRSVFDLCVAQQVLIYGFSATASGRGIGPTHSARKGTGCRFGPLHLGVNYPAGSYDPLHGGHWG